MKDKPKRKYFKIFFDMGKLYQILTKEKRLVKNKTVIFGAYDESQGDRIV